MTILDKIIAHKRKTLELDKQEVSVQTLEKSIYFSRETFSLRSSLSKENTTGIIAEFKRQSPSKGIINNKADVQQITSQYAKAGASALSILTNNEFFGGSNDDLTMARKVNDIPILRKEFVVDEYQIFEAKSIGADAILLIAAILSANEIIHFTKIAHSLELEILVEVHDLDDINKLSGLEDIIGVNNRNLKTFEVNIKQSMDLIKRLPNDAVKISESGIKTPEDIQQLRMHGFSGFLIGELFMREVNPGIVCESLIDKLRIMEGIKS